MKIHACQVLCKQVLIKEFEDFFVCQNQYTFLMLKLGKTISEKLSLRFQDRVSSGNRLHPVADMPLKPNHISYWISMENSWSSDLQIASPLLLRIPLPPSKPLVRMETLRK